ncbi:hypothetical protein [Flectobacillus roseus]|uniref:hypothetical protein n=1 Tax=Flectobacillus roseus TaxID=502259 RepID=UPI0024B719CB|nr:hypothetical protein [Flectobacillus roseus]MDI9872594.1 hypothetical protein [Flectobacillus roseus]
MEDIARVGIGARVPELTKKSLEVEAGILGFEGLSSLLNYLISNRSTLYINRLDYDAHKVHICLSESELSELYEVVKNREKGQNESQKLDFQDFLKEVFFTGLAKMALTHPHPLTQSCENSVNAVNQPFTRVNASVNEVKHGVNAVNDYQYDGEQPDKKPEIQTQSSFAVKLRLEELETQLQQAQQEAIYYRSQYEKLSLVQASQQENTASYQALSIKFDELLKGLEYVFGVAAELANEPHFRGRDYTPEYFAELLEKHESTSGN